MYAALYLDYTQHSSATRHQHTALHAHFFSPAGNKLRSFVHSYELAEGKWHRSSPFPLELIGAVAFKPSPSGKLLAIIREDSASGKDSTAKDAAYVIEIWSNEDGQLMDRIATAGVHGKIAGGTWFGGLNWSPDESTVVYVAQKKATETRSFFSKPQADKTETGSKSSPLPGEQFVYEEDWGEKYEGVSRLGLFLADIGGSGEVKEIPGISSTLTPGQPQFSKDGRHVVYTAWDCEPRKLGMIYCYQRPCKLYSAPVGSLLKSMDGEAAGGSGEEDSADAGKTTQQEGIDKQEQEEHTCLCPSWRLARSARFSPSGDSLVWLSREEGFDTHSGCFRLTSASWDPEKGALGSPPRTLVDVVAAPESSAAFPGLWVDDLPDACWTPDGGSIFLSSAWGSRQSVVKVDAETGEVGRVVRATAAAGQDPSTGDPKDASASVLAVGEAGVYVVASSPNSPGGFAVLPAAGGGPGNGEAVLGPAVGGVSVSSSIRVGRAQAAGVKRALDDAKWRVISVPVPGVDDEAGEPQQEQTIEAVLIMPPHQGGGGAKAAPLVVVPHGGPHGVMPTAFVPSYAFLSATQGFAVLHVNFRGSTGFGTTALESLPGRIGKQDVADVVAATKAALALEPEALDAARVGVVGGSHGGFLGAHLTAQHPEIFKATALRNPVTNIASMVTVSDIPDWCYVEALGCGKYNFDAFKTPTAEDLHEMWKASPVAHIDGVVAPTLVALGAKDRRVPHSQGLEWFHALRSRGVKTKLLVYPEDVHAIDMPASEADQWLNIVGWLKKHLA
ncbi:conserved unknown protein [Ectocarpus siliculosus]|uniref:acylaminoacyl-peptidase n=1 Tax=Ectocarpus siliculosus TaxID=2880 RepID=D7FQR6_ECTSI|nr:conserved unknown protein [Ectocarpus siliculosus]|eukprot:CBJ49173.1 conserved unknown protein [Ectocarpus siliculosus]